MPDCKLTNAGDDDRFTCLKGGLEEFQNSFQQPNCFFHRESRLLMNSHGNIRRSHSPITFLRQAPLVYERIPYP